MRVLDLCTEFGSETKAFKDRGHEVITLGIEGNVDIKCDVRQYYPSIHDEVDYISAHPPCQQYSIADWRKGKCNTRMPDHSILDACFRIINTLKPKYWIIENPVGCMRYFIRKLYNINPTYTINYSDFGFISKKPTDLWGNLPFFRSYSPNLDTKQLMNVTNGFTKEGRAQRSIVPYELSLAICKAIEQDLIE